jgi:transposase
MRTREEKEVSWRKNSEGTMSQAKVFSQSLKHQHVYKLAGSPLLWQIMNTLQIEETTDEHCPCGDRIVSHGQAALALLLTRLIRPKALYKVAGWLKRSGIAVLLEHEAKQFTDDALGGTLDAIGEQTEGLWIKLVGQALTHYPEVAERVIQYDITSCYFEGAYEESELIQYGYSRDNRPDAKQVNVGLSITGESGLPLLYELLAGNTADNQTPFGHLDKLNRLLDQVDYPHEIVMVSDRAMLNRKLIGGYLARGQQFLGPWTPSEVLEIVAAVPHEELMAHPLDYRPQSAKDTDPPSYYGIMRTVDFDPHGQQATTLRLLVLYSRGKARLDADKRANHLAKARAAFDDIQGKLNRRRYKRACYVEQRIRTELKKCPAARGLLTWTLSGEDGDLSLTLELDEAALAAAQHMDGRYALVTNSDLSANEMLVAFKHQSTAEHRFRIIKGPVPIRPIHLRKENRIRAMVFLTMLALLVYSILEWLVRSQTPGRRRPWTGRAVLEIFEEFAVVAHVFADGSRLWLPPPLSDTQQTLWDVLGLPHPVTFLAQLEVGT